MAAAAAKDHGFVELTSRPNFRRMSGEFRMAFVTREPFPTAFEFDRDDVAFASIMRATRFLIDAGADDVYAMNAPDHLP